MGVWILTAGILAAGLLAVFIRWLRRTLRGETRDEPDDEPLSASEEAAGEGIFQVLAKFFGG